MVRASILAAVLALGFAVPAGAQNLEAAKEEAGPMPAPVAQFTSPVGRVEVERAELLAATYDQPVRFKLTLDRAVAEGVLRIAVPRRWRETPHGGARPSTARRDAVELVLDGGSAGDVLTAEVRDRGIPAGTYQLPVSLGVDGGRERRVGRLETIFYAPVREEAERPWDDVRAIGVSNSPLEQSETFVTVAPGNPDRLLASANGGFLGYGAWISQDGGDTWIERPMPTADADVSGEASPLSACCDPMSAADPAGNFWYGGLDRAPDSHIIVGRIPAGGDDFVSTVALPSRTPSATQDKPMMTIDNSPSSPTFGRLYVVWNEPTGGGINVVVSFCDTRPDAGACDAVTGWSQPATITKGGAGSFIYADVAVAPDGKVYVVWWNYSAVNAIEGSTCSADCSSPASWSAVHTKVADLDKTNGAPIPFACPILAQPGGRASTGPNVEVSRGDGRVYVTWSDLRTGSGSTRCAGGLTPAATHLRFDSLVKSAAAALPTAAQPATRLLTDAEDPNSDDWFPWIAVDQTTGVAYAAFYSTREDPQRRKVHFYARSVGADGTLGPLVRTSDQQSDMSNNTCCGFGNDYGDYAGIDATNGVVYPIWSEKVGFDTEAVTDQMRLPAPGGGPSLLPGAASVADPAPGGDGDGVPEPGEVIDVSIPVTNAGAGAAPAVTAELATTSKRVSVPRPKADLGPLAAGATSSPAVFRVALADTLACGESARLRLRVDAGGESALDRYAIGTGTGQATVGTADADVPIPDGTGQVAASPLTVTEPGDVGDVDVVVNVSHTWVGDVSLALQHPDGTVAVLVARAGGRSNHSGDNYVDTVFDDEASTAFGGAAPFTGSFRPLDRLDALDGKPWAGTWALLAEDADAPDSGSITSWSLRRRTCSPLVPNQAPNAAISGPGTAAPGQTLAFSAAGSADPDGVIIRHQWDLDGDGGFETDTGGSAAAQTAFATAGSRTVRLRVTDEEGATGETSQPVVVAAPTPAATPTPTPAPFIALAKPGQTLKARSGRLAVALRGCAGCKGTLVLQTRGKVRVKRGAKAKRVRLGRATFTVAANGTAKVTIRLSKANRALLKRLRRIGLTAKLSVTDAAGRRATGSGRLTLRR